MAEPFLDSKHSDYSPSSTRTRVRLPPWKWRMTKITSRGTTYRSGVIHTIDGVVRLLQENEASRVVTGGGELQNSTRIYSGRRLF